MTATRSPTLFETEYAALLLDYAAGAAPAELALLVETYSRLSTDGQRHLAMAEAAGAVILESEPGSPMSAAPALAPSRRPAPCPQSDDAFHRARGAVAAAIGHADIVSWRWRLPGYREHDLGLRDLRLVRLAKGDGLPPHGHEAEEWTLVLAGAFEDQHGLYRRGDLAFAGPGDWHSPRVISVEDCVCLAATSAPLTFASPFGRAAAWILEKTGA